MLTAPHIRLAADIGGTFTDVVLDVDGTRSSRKVLTTPAAPEDGMLYGMELALQDAGLMFSDVATIVHGTTLATNAIIERRGAVTALVGTDGFRDILDIGTESRFSQYDLMLVKPSPLAPRERRYSLPERIDATGKVQHPLDEAAVHALAQTLADDGIEAVAICFLHAYRNPEHEIRAGEILRAALPDVSITLSHEVCPEVREYERASTAVANAYVQPLMSGYLGRMADQLRPRQFRGATYLVTSGGGLTSLETAQQYPVRLVESGPAGGAIFAAQVAMQAEAGNVVSFDMGGTTAKICLIENGEPATSRVFEVDRTARFMKGSGLPLRIPVIEMVEIGAGGGSIAHLDSMGQIAVGPESASSVPGPAAYDRGGDRPTVTDSDVVLGLISPEGFANGTMTLRPDLSRAALSRDVGDALGLTPEHAAHAIYEMVCENMASAARMHAAECGVALDGATMIAFGGAAPLHAARLAEKTQVTRILIPANAGVGSAVGFLTAPVAYEITRSRPMRLDETFDAPALTEMFSEMRAQARALVEPGAQGAPLFERIVGYMRYQGQGHEIAVEMPAEGLDAEALRAVRAAFETEYERQFARALPNAGIEAITWSVLVSTHPSRPDPAGPAGTGAAPEPVETRKFYDGRSKSFVDLPAYDRTALSAGGTISGPAVITEIETTTFVSSAFTAHVDGAGCIVLEKKEG